MTWPKSDSDHLIVTSSEMEALENKIFERGMPVEALMEKVGLGMRDWILERPELTNEGVVVLVGPGHNGGDGLVLARELFLAGIEVSIWCPFKHKKELTRKHLSYCKSIGIEQLHDAPDVMSKKLWIDALFGIGQSRPLPRNIESLFYSRQEKNLGCFISLDVPSGICSDTGKLLSNFVPYSSFTLTVGLIKKGLLQDCSLPYLGELIRIDIGLPENFLAGIFQYAPLKISSKDLTSLNFPKLALNLNKYQRGRLLVLAGSQKYLGAAILALKGALASGVGSINAVIPEAISNSLWKIAPEVVISGAIQTSIDGQTLLARSLALQKLDNLDALLIGPGLGPSDENWEEVDEVLAKFAGLLVLDADALNRLSKSSQGWKWILKREGPTWLTPHRREFDRLFPELIDLEPFEAVSEASSISGSSILLKGAHTVISDPFGKKWQLVETNSNSARVGLGDVLAGFSAGIGGLGMSMDNQSENNFLAISAFIHSQAAKNCPEGTSASLIADFLAKLVKSLQDGKCLQKHI